jgi:hypothetical protein
VHLKPEKPKTRKNLKPERNLKKLETRKKPEKPQKETHLQTPTWPNRVFFLMRVD